MGKKPSTLEQIIRKLREVGVLISQRMKTPLADRQTGIIKQTYYCKKNIIRLTSVEITVKMYYNPKLKLYNCANQWG